MAAKGMPGALSAAPASWTDVASIMACSIAAICVCNPRQMLENTVEQEAVQCVQAAAVDEQQVAKSHAMS